MLKAVEGIYRNGKVELLETPEDIEAARVVVTLHAGTVNRLGERGESHHGW